MVEPPPGRAAGQIGDHCASEASHVDAGMLIEILVFSRQEGSLDAIRDCLDRQEQSALLGILRHQRAVACMDAGRYRWLVATQHCVVRKILRDGCQINGNNSRYAQEQDASHSEEISKKSNHI